MADINVERRKRSLWPLLLVLLVVAAVAIAAWVYFGDRDTVVDTMPATEQPEYTAPAPVTPVDTGSPGT